MWSSEQGLWQIALLRRFLAGYMACDNEVIYFCRRRDAAGLLFCVSVSFATICSCLSCADELAYDVLQ